MVVYLDILFFINLIMNYIILIVTSVFSGFYVPRIKIFASSLLGAMYAIVAFFGNFNFIFNILVGVLMVLITFGKKNLLKQSLLFFMIAFMFAGGIIAIFYFSKNPSYMLLNGIPYIEIKIDILVSTFILCYVALCILNSNLGKNKILSDNITHIFVKIGDKSVKISTFLDSGNALLDIITGKPVIVVEGFILKEILPYDLHCIVTQNPYDALQSSAKFQNSLRIRIINFKSLGNSNGVMTIFTPDEILDKNGKKIDALIGISLCEINLSGCFAIMGQ